MPFGTPLRELVEDFGGGTASGRPVRLEIDGGVKVDNIGEIAAAGADTFVAGSAIFGSRDYQATINAFREKIGV